MNQKLFHPLFIALFLLLLCLLLNYSALMGNWRWDDSSVLLHLFQYSLVDDFIKAEVWREFSRTNLMPWMVLSYQVDLHLFGLKPNLFYIHHLFALTASSMALCYLLSLWVRKPFAVLGAGLFLLSTPSLVVAQQLMTRHYIEGLLFCLLALIFFVKFLRKESKRYLVMSVIFYTLSVTAKEIYVPLVVLLPFLPESNIRSRLVATLPFVMVVSVYIIWRNHMLGTLTGGYTQSDIFLTAAFIPEVLQSFTNFPALLYPTNWVLFSLAFISLLAVYCYLSRSKLMLSSLVLLLILLPLIPLVRSPGIVGADRYLFLLATAISFSIAYYADAVVGTHLQQRPKLKMLCLTIVFPVFVFVSFSSGMETRKGLLRSTAEYDVQADFIWNNNASVAFEPSQSLKASYWFVSDLIDFKQRLLVGETAAVAVPDGLFLLDSIESLYVYDHSCECMQDISGQLSDRRNQFSASLNTTAPLSVEFQYSENGFSWQFGPYQEGMYSIVSNVLGVAVIPSSGRVSSSVKNGASMYVRYESPQGWVTYSDELRVVHNGPAVSWSRR